MARSITGSGLGVRASCNSAGCCVRLEDVEGVPTEIRDHEVFVRRVCDRGVRVCAACISVDGKVLHAPVTYDDCLELLGPGCEIVNLVFDRSCELLES